MKNPKEISGFGKIGKVSYHLGMIKVIHWQNGWQTEYNHKFRILHPFGIILFLLFIFIFAPLGAMFTDNKIQDLPKVVSKDFCWF